MSKFVAYKDSICLAFINYEKGFNSVKFFAVMLAQNKQVVEGTHVTVLEDGWPEFNMMAWWVVLK